MRIRVGVISTAAALGVSACGSAGSPAASRPPPPSPILVSAYASAAQLRVSPARFGAGPVLLVITNQTRRSVALRLRRGSRVLARTAPINPHGVTQLKVELRRGAYTLSVGAAGRRTEAQRTLPVHVLATRLRVGRVRAGSGASLPGP